MVGGNNGPAAGEAPTLAADAAALPPEGALSALGRPGGGKTKPRVIRRDEAGFGGSVRCRRVASGSLLEDFDCGKDFAFEELEEGAAAGGDVADTVTDAIFGDGGERVAAASDGEGFGVGDGLGKRFR